MASKLSTPMVETLTVARVNGTVSPGAAYIALGTPTGAVKSNTIVALLDRGLLLRSPNLVDVFELSLNGYKALNAAGRLSDDQLADEIVAHAEWLTEQHAEAFQMMDDERRDREVAEDLGLVPSLLIDDRPKIDKYDRQWAMSFPLSKHGDGNVMQGHVDYCAEHGHATEERDGVKQGHCPRCGDLLAKPKFKAPQYFARRTRRGVETVVVEREHAGRVDYRVIDSTTGRRSAPYRMRSATFTREYVAVPR